MRFVVMLGVACAGLGGCGDSSGTPMARDSGVDGGAQTDPGEGEAAELLVQGEELLWRVLGGEVERRGEAIEVLSNASRAEEALPRAKLLYPLALLSAVVEDGDLARALSLETAFEAAREANPDDARINGWQGILRVTTAQLFGDAADVDEAAESMVDAADLYPEFNNISLAIAFTPLSLDSGYPETAVARLEAIEDCVETESVCQNTERAPHNVAGTHMLFGDVYARVGDTEKARLRYQMAVEEARMAGWRFQALAEDRLMRVDERATLYLDADPDNDPTFFFEGSTSCVGCHGR